MHKHSSVNTKWMALPLPACMGPLGVRNTGLSREGSNSSSLSSVSLISASSLLSSSEKIPPSLLVMLWISPSGSVSDSPCMLAWWLSDSVKPDTIWLPEPKRLPSPLSLYVKPTLHLTSFFLSTCNKYLGIH